MHLRTHAILLVLVALATELRGQEGGVPDKKWSRIHLQPQEAQIQREHSVVHFPSTIVVSNLPPQDSPDIEITPLTNTTQSENSVFVSPLNENVVLNSNNSSNYPVSSIYGADYFVSTDGGLTWTGSVQGAGGTNRGDPAAVIGLNGNMYINYIAANSGNGTARSTNNGLTWTHVQVAPNPGSLADKNHMWIDNSPTSPYQGNLYAIWTDFGGINDNHIVVSRSVDHGLSWSTRVKISDSIAAGSHNQGVNIQTGPNGAVYAVWAVYDSWPALETALGFARSLNGGATWEPAKRAITNIKGIRSQATGGGLLGGKDMRTASFPSMAVNQQNGNIYVVWTNIGVPGINTGTERDVYMAKSINGGTSWGTPVRVNQDTPNNGRDQWFPWISCDPVTGILSVIFYDSRDFAGNDMTHTYVAISRDDGATWEDFRVSDVAWNGDGSGTGFSGNYAGDYIAITSRNGKVYPVWTDRRQSGRLSTWVSPFSLADPADPNPPTSVWAYSSIATPTSMQLSWRNPTTLVNGNPIGPFVTRIKRNGVQITERPSTDSTYTDIGLTTYQSYTYTFQTRLLSNDSLSVPVEATWIAGGSPVPGPPTNVVLNASGTQASLSWTNPTTQSDGTPMHDFGGTIILRGGIPVDSVGPGATSYVDTPPPGFVYCYALRAFNTLVPRRYSSPTTEQCAYVGTVPEVLVWQPSRVTFPSGDSISASLTRLGKSNLKVDTLFAFGPNLSQYQAIFAVIGVYPNNLVITTSRPEGPALDAYVLGGGKLYMEGGDVFNYDPEAVSGYQVRPIFGLNDGADGGADVASVSGRTLFNGLSFTYTGPNSFMDELRPNSGGGSRVLYVVPGSTPANDTSAVFNYYGGGRSIAAVPSFGGLVDAGANRKDSLMARMLQFFSVPLTPPAIGVSPASLSDTLVQNQTSSTSFTISNTATPPASNLIVGIAESASWLTVSHTTDTVAAGQNKSVGVGFDATGLPIGTHTTNIVVTSNDATSPTIQIPVTLTVLSPPVLSARPDSILRSMPANATAAETLVIKNTGGSVLAWAIADLPAMVQAAGVPQMQADQLYPSEVGRDGWPIPVEKDSPDRHRGPAVLNGSGGPDSAGYRWYDSDEPGGPQFDWFDIASIGTQITGWIGSTGSSNADDGRVVLPIPFAFPFYGNTYDSIKVVTNGWVSFATLSTSTEWTNSAIPSSGEPNLALFAFWDDLDIRTSGTVHYYHHAAQSRFIIQYTNVPHYSTLPGLYTFQIILKADGSILYQYLSMQQTLNSATIGIENNSGTVGLQVVFNQNYVHDGLAISFAKDVAWLSENPISGAIAPGDSAKVAVIFNSTGLSDGEYRANLSITSNDFASGEKIIPVKMTVGGMTTLNLPVAEGWNIVSKPVSGINDSVLSMFPTSSFSHAFTFQQGTGYIEEYTLRGGVGYWMKFPAATNVTIEGETISRDTIAVQAGWNMIGSISSSIDTGGVTSTPSGIRASHFYAYAAGYTATNVIEPGRGYWVRTSAPGWLVLSSTPLPAHPHSAGPGGRSFNSITVADANGSVQTLYFGVAGDGGGSPSMFELPPPGPEGTMDVRFESGSQLALFDAQRFSAHAVVMRSARHPLTVSWDVESDEGHGFRLSDGPQQSFTRELVGKGSVTIASPSIHRLVISSEASEAPTQFSLGANYPNPFNPTTTITFQIPNHGEGGPSAKSQAAVTLRVYDVLGGVVATLVDGEVPAGVHGIGWDGTNNTGKPVGSGVYFYRLDVRSSREGALLYTAARSMLLLR